MTQASNVILVEPANDRVVELGPDKKSFTPSRLIEVPNNNICGADVTVPVAETFMLVAPEELKTIFAAG